MKKIYVCLILAGLTMTVVIGVKGIDAKSKNDHPGTVPEACWVQLNDNYGYSIYVKEYDTKYIYIQSYIKVLGHWHPEDHIRKFIKKSDFDNDYDRNEYQKRIWELIGDHLYSKKGNTTK